MAWKNPTQWGDMSNALNVISMLLIFLCALTGAVSCLSTGSIFLRDSMAAEIDATRLEKMNRIKQRRLKTREENIE